MALIYKKPIYLSFLFLLVNTLLCVIVITEVSANAFAYFIFTASFNLLLVSAFYKNQSYFYTFISVMFWLGFWLKFNVHFFFNYDFVEPVGYFIESSGAWNEVFLLSSAGAISLFLSKMVFNRIFINADLNIEFNKKCFVPNWYERYRARLWSVIIFSIVVSALLNTHYSFQQIGIVAKTIIWPVNALIFLLTSTGFVLAIITLIGWDIKNNKSPLFGFYVLLLEAFFSTISILSRGVYVFHSIPVYYGVVKSKLALRKVKRVQKTNVLFYIFIFLIGFMVALPVVNSLRDVEYSINYADKELIISSKSLQNLLSFSVDRWIGLEGTMALVGYSEKNFSLLFDATVEKGAIGKSSLYQYIANSHYKDMDLNKFQFATLPGPVAFFYFSGEVWFVFWGLIVLFFLMMLFETWVHQLLGNPLLTSYFSFTLAVSVSQMGVAISGLLFSYFLIVLGILFIWFLQNTERVMAYSYFNEINKKLLFITKKFGKKSR